MTTIIPSSNRDLPDPNDGNTGDVPVLQANKTVIWSAGGGGGADPAGTVTVTGNWSFTPGVLVETTGSFQMYKEGWLLGTDTGVGSLFAGQGLDIGSDTYISLQSVSGGTLDLEAEGNVRLESTAGQLSLLGDSTTRITGNIGASEILLDVNGIAISSPDGSVTIDSSGVSIVTAGIINLDGNLALTAPLSVDNGGTGLNALGAADSILGVNSGGTALEYKSNIVTTDTSQTISGTKVFNTGAIHLKGAGSAVSYPVSHWTTDNRTIYLPPSVGIDEVCVGAQTLTADTGLTKTLDADFIPTIKLQTNLQPIATLGAANTIVGVNSGATSAEYKALAADANDTVGITHGANSITLESKTNTATLQNITTTPVTLLTTSPEDIWIDINGSSKTVNMPSASTIKYFRIRCYHSSETSSSNTASIVRAGSDVFTTGAASSSSLTMVSGDTVELRSDGGTRWMVVGGLQRGSNSGVSGYWGIASHDVLQHRTAAYTASSVTLTNSGATSDNTTISYWDTSSNTITANLPAIVSSAFLGSGKVYVLVKISASNSLIIDPNSSQTINGAATFTLTELGEAVAIQNANGISSSTDWKILWHYRPSLDTTLGTANQILGVNSGATATEYKALASADGSVLFTHAANSINLKATPGDAASKRVTSGTTALEFTDESYVICDTTGGAITLNLPTIGSTEKTWTIYVIASSGSNTVTVNRGGSDTIGSSSSQVLKIRDFLTIKSDPTNSRWDILTNGITSANISGFGTSIGSLGNAPQVFPTVNRSTGANLDGTINSSSGTTVQVVDTTSGDATFTLPAGATTGTVRDKLFVFVKTMAANSLILDASSTQTINGSLTQTLTEAGEAMCIQMTAQSSTDWKILWHHKPSVVSNGSDPTITALAAYNTNGLLTQTAADTFTGRTITGTTNQISVSNGDGVSGNPTLSTPQDIHTGASPTFAGLKLNDTAANNTAELQVTSNLAANTVLQYTGDGASYYGATIDPILTSGSDLVVSGDKIFLNGTIWLTDPSITHNTILKSAEQTGNFDLTVPVLIANDTIATLGVDQTFTGANTFAGITLSNDLVFNTVGDTVQIKTGSNGMMGTTDAMTAGTVTVTNSNVLTGDIIIATRVSGAGASAGITSYSIVNATSFTLNGIGTDDGVYAYVIFRPSP